jgi:plastocyanin
MGTGARMSLLETVIVTLAVAAACAMPVASGSAPAPELEVVVGSAAGDGLTFVPAAIAAPADTLIRVAYRNDSSEAHNLTFQGPISAATRTIVDPGATDVATFVTPAAGSYTFVCTIHVGMSGTLTVR